MLSKKKLSALKVIKEKIVVFKTALNVDLLWHISEIFYKIQRQRPRPNWNGLMNQLSSEKRKKTQSPKSTITMLPVIDLNPHDESYLYPTLNIEIPSTKLCELNHLNNQN